MASLLASRCRVNLSARNFSSSQPSEGYIQMFTDKGSRSEPTSGTLRLLTVINEYLANLALEVSLLSNLTTMSLLPALATATLAALRPKQTHDQSVWQYLLGRFANFCCANRRGCEKLRKRVRCLQHWTVKGNIERVNSPCGLS